MPRNPHTRWRRVYGKDDLNECSENKQGEDNDSSCPIKPPWAQIPAYHPRISLSCCVRVITGSLFAGCYGAIGSAAWATAASPASAPCDYYPCMTTRSPACPQEPSTLSTLCPRCKPPSPARSYLPQSLWIPPPHAQHQLEAWGLWGGSLSVFLEDSDHNW